MPDMLAFKAGTRDGTVVSGKGRIIYPSLLVATNRNGGTDGPEDKLRYRLGLLVPRQANTDALTKAVDAVIAEQKESDRRQARKPYIKVADQNSLAAYAEEFPLLLRMTSKYKPRVVGFNPNEEIEDESEIYSGRWGKVSFNPFWYPSIDGGKPGVALGIQNVQFLDPDEMIGGRRVDPADEFDYVPPTGGDATEPASNSALEDMFD